MTHFVSQIRVPPGWQRSYPELQRLSSTTEREAAWGSALADNHFVEHVAFLLTSVAAFPYIGIIIAAALQGKGILPRFSLYWLIVAAAIVLLLIGLGWARDRHRRKRLAEFSIVLLAVLWMACDLVFRIRGGADRLTLGLAIPLYFLIPVVVLFVSRRRGIRKSLWVYLNACGKATCVSCGYDLTGNESGVCPECGSEVQA